MREKNTSYELYSRQKITISIRFMPEMFNLIKRQSDKIPTLYFLDICVVGATKFSDSELKGNPRKSKLIDKLRGLDEKQNSFSYLLALMEKVSDTRGRLSDAELERQIIDDVSALRLFFKKATVYEDNDFIVLFLRELRGEPIEVKRPCYLDFLVILNNEFVLADAKSPKDRFEYAKKILNKADILEVSRQHPIVTMALACLYGNIYAKKLMKFKSDSKKFEAENALADIMAIPRYLKIKLEIESYAQEGRGKFSRVNFITDDDGLAELIENYKPIFVKYNFTQEGRYSLFRSRVGLRRILTEIQEDEYDEIVKLLSSVSIG